MTASLNIQAAKRTDIVGLAGHAYREGDPGDHVDKSRTHLNRILAGPTRYAEMKTALRAIPDRQPDTGRKIRADARVMCQAVMTLPEELQEADVDRWAAASVAWLRDRCPGKLQYATLHLDESRPHIHAGILPANDAGNLNYKRDFGGDLAEAKAKMRALQESYSLALEPLGVAPPGRDGREYKHKGIDGWRGFKAEHAEKARTVEASDQVTRTAERAETAEKNNVDLVAENQALREKLKESGIATRENYRDLATIKKSDMEIGEKVQRMVAYVDDVLREQAPAPEPDRPRPATPAIAPELLAWREREKERREEEAEKLKLAEAEKTRLVTENNQLQQTRADLKTAREERDQASTRAVQAEKDLETARQQPRPAAPAKITAEARKEITDARDKEWRTMLKDDRNQVVRELDRLKLPEAKMIESGKSFRERVEDHFTSWRAKLLNYVADLKKKLQKAEKKATDFLSQREAVKEDTRPYRELVVLMTPEERTNIDTQLEKMTAERQEASAEYWRQKREKDREEENQPGMDR